MSHQARLKFFDGELFAAVFVHIRRFHIFHAVLAELYDIYIYIYTYIYFVYHIYILYILIYIYVLLIISLYIGHVRVCCILYYF